MTVQEIIKRIAKREGKKHEASVGDVREIVAIVADIIFEDSDPATCTAAQTLFIYGRKRAGKAKK